MTDTEGIAAGDLTDIDLLRELEVLHTTRNGTLRHGSAQALDQHSRRMAELEREYLARYPDREIDPARTRSGSRVDAVFDIGHEPPMRTGADQPWDPEDLAVAEGRDPTTANIERARRELESDGPAAIERTVP